MNPTQVEDYENFFFSMCMCNVVVSS